MCVRKGGCGHVVFKGVVKQNIRIPTIHTYTFPNPDADGLTDLEALHLVDRRVGRHLVVERRLVTAGGDAVPVQVPGTWRRDHWSVKR